MTRERMTSLAGSPGHGGRRTHVAYGRGAFIACLAIATIAVAACGAASTPVPSDLAIGGVYGGGIVSPSSSPETPATWPERRTD